MNIFDAIALTFVFIISIFLFRAINYLLFKEVAFKSNEKNFRKEKNIFRLNLQFFSKLKEIYNSIMESPNYPVGFKSVQNGCTRNRIKDSDLLDELRKIEPGEWKKIYKDGYDERGGKISIHYFQSRSGKVFNVKTKNAWSNKK